MSKVIYRDITYSSAQRVDMLHRFISEEYNVTINDSNDPYEIQQAAISRAERRARVDRILNENSDIYAVEFMPENPSYPEYAMINISCSDKTVTKTVPLAVKHDYIFRFGICEIMNYAVHYSML